MFYNTLKLIHENLGRASILLAIINISIGVFYAVFEWYWILIWFCYLAAFIIIYLLFELNIYFSKQEISKSIASKNEQDIDIDGYDLNISKTGSTQQLTPSFSNENGPRGNRDAFQMETIRYATNNINSPLKKDKNANSKYSPSTPPPPYFNKGNKHQAFSTINLKKNSELECFPSTSSPLPDRKNLSKLAYSQEINDIELTRQSGNANTNQAYQPTRIQNANQVYSIQNTKSPNESLKFYKNETNFSYNNSMETASRNYRTSSQISQNSLSNNNCHVNKNSRY